MNPNMKTHSPPHLPRAQSKLGLPPLPHKLYSHRNGLKTIPTNPKSKLPETL
ncbi:hypothetical protein CCACVL1_25333 [Corchorus capsularis]|uniref:Uncharacterized protein n=1 Tax=Corchorus capsularis TaxID=210143 RepID=A0A1R3GL98_COCAP|nr:hypothetical protein CCACVL1_25333 [Corchorus capsularis]